MEIVEKNLKMLGKEIMKRTETIELENALIEKTRIDRIYGCEEITIGFYNNGHGNEVVDFMTMDSKGIIRCYELKVTLQDLKSDAKKSFYGNYNYLVISNALQDEIIEKKIDIYDFIPDYVGLIVGKGLISQFKCKKQSISKEQSEMLKESMIRSMYFKMIKYKDSADMEKQKKLNSYIRSLEKDFKRYKDKTNELEEELYNIMRGTRETNDQF